MAHAYTPGLKVTEEDLVIKRRILPLKGNVLVKKNDHVKSDDIVARTFLPGDVEPMNLTHILGTDPGDVPNCMLKKIGDEVKKGDLIAESKGIFGFFKTKAYSKVDGKIESVSNITGQIILRSAPISVEVKAYVNGLVTEIIPDVGVVIETNGAFIQGIFGIGGETNGIIVFVCKSSDEILDETKLNESHKGKVVVGGSLVTTKAIRKAVQIGVEGIISGGINDEDLKEFMGKDIGVAITGSEELGITLIITEGFSKINMSERTFSLLKKNEGKFACINGTTQIRAGVMRPEIIIPKTEGSLARQGKTYAQIGIMKGSPVRIIREPYFGKIGVVTDLPPELQRLESLSLARICKVKIDGNNEVMIPRANIEIIEN